MGFIDGILRKIYVAIFTFSVMHTVDIKGVTVSSSNHSRYQMDQLHIYVYLWMASAKILTCRGNQIYLSNWETWYHQLVVYMHYTVVIQLTHNHCIYLVDCTTLQKVVPSWVEYEDVQGLWSSLMGKEGNNQPIAIPRLSCINEDLWSSCS